METTRLQSLIKGKRFWQIERTETSYRTIYGTDKEIYGAWITESKINEKITKLYKDKLSTGYSETGVTELDVPVMLASSGESPEFPCFAQYKFNGCRGRVKREGVFTKNSQGYLARKLNLPTITYEASVLQTHLELYFDKEVQIDGEVYRHNDFLQNITGLISKRNPDKAELDLIDSTMEYHVYDVIIAGYAYNERLAAIDKAFNELHFFKLKKADTVLLNNQEEADEFYKNALALKYEGIMYRKFDGLYDFGKRSKNLIKRKPFQDAEFEIVDIQEGKDRRAGEAARFVLKTNDYTFICDYSPQDLPEGKTATIIRKDILNRKDEIIGKLATVRYKDFTVKGIPTEARIICIRDYEEIYF